MFNLKNKGSINELINMIETRYSIFNLKIENEKIKIDKDIDWDYINSPNLLIQGKSGSGKTCLILSMLVQILTKTKFVNIFDPTYSYISNFNDIDSLKDEIFNDNYEISKQIHNIYEGMIRRSKINMKMNIEDKLNSYTEDDVKPQFIVFDEISLWILDGQKYSDNSDERQAYKLALSDFFEILIRGRALGIYVIISIQDSLLSVLPSIIRSQINLNIFMGMLDDNGTVPALYSELKGWGVVKKHDGSIHAFYSPEIPKNNNLHEFIKYIGI
ncbi:FtsK/SpoIIIE domain-containing protein [Weissella koreensis]|uniref:FtsK/SpoIIIE domain-containing protein n=1 Tax=Weissella koreensis TaxID=165096 RepID=UPI0022BA3ED9|nr:FtsK/SpoIIIE domain-containing protein [Weissella koreensis]MCZ9310535.1 FtsK/SpoIIIE domain-containing protein [Weissella koreensis]